jgi:S-DNA-T family DNA segregation ATPase FtsK/SpoIIIE
MQIYFIGDIAGSTLGTKIANMWDMGKNWQGGGFASFIVAMPLIKLFGELGARIIVALLLFGMVMYVVNISPADILRLITYPFRQLFAPTYYDDEEEENEGYYDASDDEEEDKRSYNPIDIILSKKKNRSTEGNSAEQTEPTEDVPFDIQLKSKKTNDTEPNSLIKSSPSDGGEETENEEIYSLINKAITPKSKKEKLAAEQLEQIAIIQEEIEEKSVNLPTNYEYPPLDFLKSSVSRADDESSIKELKDKADILVDTLNSFGVETRIIDINRGPAVTRYEVQPAAGVKVSKITSLADDIALNLAAAGVRIEAPIPGKAAVGIEIPNANKDIVSLREMLESEEFTSSKSKLSFAVGRDIAGNTIIGDVAKMPHVIIAGATGSGKSVCTNSIIMSILYHASPEEVRLVLIDPKIVEFKVYDGIPHLLIPVVTDPRKAAGALNWAVQEMLRRYQVFADSNVRDIGGYNEYAVEQGLPRIPQIVIAIDELADLMMAASKEVEDSICRLAQMARAAGMHLIIATQRPTVNIIPGLIKANIPSRIALSVMSQMDSRTILDTVGAEKLLGHGDMLYLPSGMPKPVRVQGCFTSTKEIESVVNFIKSNNVAEYNQEIVSEIEKNAMQVGGTGEEESDTDDALIEKAIDVVMEIGQASTSTLQRKLKLGYARAARIMDELENMEIIAPAEGAKPRKVLLSQIQYKERKLRRKK